jgi:hypothetical protein
MSFTDGKKIEMAIDFVDYIGERLQKCREMIESKEYERALSIIQSARINQVAIKQIIGS